MFDWIGLTLTLLGSLTVIKKNKYGFLLMGLGCLSWIGFGLQVNSLAVVITNIIFFVINIFGFDKWKKEDNQK